MTTETTQSALLTTDELLKHWQGHRRLTRRTIEAFPAGQLFEFRIGGMRTFGELATEFLGMTLPTVRGISTGSFGDFKLDKPKSKDEVLKLWDEQTAMLDEEFPRIPLDRFGEKSNPFGAWEDTGLAFIQYAIENEVHHRGQGFVYLRALGIEPPHFWERD
ncbi:DinB family protein [Silvibacterium acidisoli]|uniref:DinB family protein n=1 Tax=Acidobacteriaceae bacterium ZG23-2 TaxID=2883246 RepID=UPI00406BF704